MRANPYFWQARHWRFRVVLANKHWYLGYQTWDDALGRSYFGLCIVPALMFVFGYPHHSWGWTLDAVPFDKVYRCPLCHVEEGKQHNGGCADQNPAHPDGLIVRRP